MHWVGVACATVLTLTAMGDRLAATSVLCEGGRLRFMLRFMGKSRLRLLGFVCALKCDCVAQDKGQRFLKRAISRRACLSGRPSRD